MNNLDPQIIADQVQREHQAGTLRKTGPMTRQPRKRRRVPRTSLISEAVNAKQDTAKGVVISAAPPADSAPSAGKTRVS